MKYLKTGFVLLLSLALLLNGEGTLVQAATPTTCEVINGQTVCYYTNLPPNGTTVENITQAGQVRVWYQFPGHLNPIRIWVKKGVEVHSFDMNQSSAGVALTLDVSPGDTLSVAACDIYFGGNPTDFSQCIYKSMGWQDPFSQWGCQAHPNPFGRAVLDFSALEATVEAQGKPIIGRQCWGDYREAYDDVDFNDFVLIFSYERTFQGYHDGNSGSVTGQSGCYANGWVRFDQNRSLDLPYRVLVDGVSVTSGLANLYRADLTSVCTGGTCAFSTSLWGLVSPNLSHTVRVQGQDPFTGNWFDLANTPRTLACLEATPTPSPTPTATPTPVPSLSVTLDGVYSDLVYFGPKVGAPTQILDGSVLGGIGPYIASVFIQKPSGSIVVYDLDPGSSFRLDASAAGDPYFGTDEEGTWLAWAQVTDAGGRTATSPAVTWQVKWYPVHGKP